MQYYGGRELAESFRTVRQNTIRIAEDIPEEQYGFRPTPDAMSVAELLSHIAVGATEAQHLHATEKLRSASMTDFPVWMQRRKDAEAGLTSKAQILDALRSGGEQWAEWLAGVSEAELGEQVTLPFGVKSRFEMLLSVKEHEMHERAKLMVIERMLGIVPHVTRDRQARMASMPQPARA